MILIDAVSKRDRWQLTLAYIMLIKIAFKRIF